MPNTKSAIKALRQNRRRRTRNLVQQRSFKNVIRKIRKAGSAKQTEEVKKLLPLACKKLDKAAKNNVIAKNKASRLKSRLSKLTRTEDLKREA